jgi:AAA domain, putative AbiEii toxin, Type IV TA system
MQPLLLIKQTLEAPQDPGPLLLDGPNVSITTVREMLWHTHSARSGAQELLIRHVDSDGESTALHFTAASGHGLSLDRLDYSHPRRNQRLSLSEASRRPTLIRAIPSEIRELFEEDPQRVRLGVQRRRSFFDIGLRLRSGPQPDDFVSIREFSTLQNFASGVIHIPGLRDIPARFYPATGVGDKFPGVFQSYVASIIEEWERTRDTRRKRLRKQLQNMGLTWKVESRRLDDTRVALLVGRLAQPVQGGASDLVNLADVGLGVSQSLPVLVALLAAARGQVVFVEQPELHLHPRAQVALGRIMLEAASQQGPTVIAETHSYLLLRSIQELVARNPQLAPFVKLHWFSRDSAGATHVDSADLDESGAFGDWPIDFADVEIEIEEQYLQAAMDRL